MQLLVISGLISCVANLLIGGFVYSRNPRKAVNLLFGLFSLTVSFWSVGSFLENVILDKAVALAVLRTNYLFGIYLPAVYLHFAYAVTRLTATRRKILGIAYLCSMLLSTIVYTPFFIQGLKLIQSGPYPFLISSPGPLYSVFFVYFAVAVTEVLKAIFQEFSISEGRRHLQMAYLIIANAIAIAAGFEYFSRVFGLFQSPPIDDYILVVYFLILAYAIVKHRLMDINVVVRRSLVYSCLIACMTATYLVVVLIAEKWFQGYVGYRAWPATVIVAFLIAIFFNPLRNWIQAFIDRALFKATPVELAEQREKLLIEVRQTERLKSVATLAAGMAHEIKNPLTAIKTFSEYLPQKHKDPEFQETFARIVPKEVTRIHSLVQRVLDFSKPGESKKEMFPLSTLIDETVEFLNESLLRHRIQVLTSYATQDGVYVDSDQMRQVFLNLLLNSIDAMKEGGGTLSIATRVSEGYAEVVITDTGCGISKEDLRRVFDPFYTTKESGTGLGLSVVRGIIEDHGGRIRMESAVGVGTSVHIQLPSAQVLHPGAEAQEGSCSKQGG